ncbi:MAG: DUF4190 domain-containing protein [Chitinophagaceae bacterium]|nr:DUF4190 domain-containing protein [Chitinophagaceae bacterium]
MRLLLTLILSMFFISGSYATSTPSSAYTEPGIQKNIYPTPQLTDILKLKVRDIERITGKKLKLKEKIAFKFLQWKIKKGLRITREEPKKNKGKTALIFGIIGLAGLITPIPIVGGLMALVGIILALVLGYQAKKENPDDKNAKTAIVLGWIGIGLVVLAVAILIAVLSTWSWGWG